MKMDDSVKMALYFLGCFYLHVYFVCVLYYSLSSIQDGGTHKVHSTTIKAEVENDAYGIAKTVQAKKMGWVLPACDFCQQMV